MMELDFQITYYNYNYRILDVLNNYKIYLKK